MNALHVVHRVHDEGTPDEQWSTYSFPVGVYTEGGSLPDARAAFRQAGRMLLGDEFDDAIVIEHLEHALYEDIYLRVAVDRHGLDRQDAARALRISLTGATTAVRNRSHVEATLPRSASGDRIVVACVPVDSLRWVLDQMAAEDAVGVCLAGPAAAGQQLVSWSFLVRENADTDPAVLANAQRLSASGLNVGSTIGELVRSGSSNDDSARGVLVGV